MKKINQKKLQLVILVIAINTLNCNGLMAQQADEHAEHSSKKSADAVKDNSTMGNEKNPKNARDPHAYSGGYTLTEGPYAHVGTRLKLADEHNFWAVLGERLEYDFESDNSIFDVQAWYGSSFNRLVIKSEGDVAKNKLEENQTDLLWGHAVSPFWDAQIGIRLDYYNQGENRQWLAFGLQGLAPYWFEIDATVYLGEDGNSALAIEATYELLFTQKLVLQPRAEITLFGKNDLANDLGNGLSSGAFGARLRYEFSRQFAPYIGVEWVSSFGKTEDLVKANGDSASETRYVAGLRYWF